jgi:hypothetical protein
MNWKLISFLGLLIASGSTGWGIAQGRAPGAALTPQDYIDIQRLYATYARAYDAGEGADVVWAETFTSDGVFAFGGREYTGPVELAVYVNNRFKSGNGGVIQHWNANVIINPALGGAVA